MDNYTNNYADNFTGNRLDYYKPSGRAPAGGIVLTILLGIICGVILSAIYSVINYINPYVYLNVLLTFGFSILTGKILSFGIRKFQIRNIAVSIFISLVVFVIAYIAHWYFYLAVTLTDWETNSIFHFAIVAEYFGLLLQYPVDTLGLIHEINDAGWSLSGRSTGSGGLPIHGILLTIIWFLEAVILVFFIITTPLNVVRTPYSERQNRWMEKLPDRLIPFIQEPEAFKHALGINDFRALTLPLTEVELNLPSGDQRYASVSVYTDQADAYITVANTFLKVKKKKKQKSENVIVKHLRVPLGVLKDIGQQQ
ncbi:MAG: hypothetical protein LBN36_02950 [Clostridiales Family XIII bacterium]|jgi:hypothetical protein|nr:hypothetical protein [Clostridiales Family XIII bacterium]